MNWNSLLALLSLLAAMVMGTANTSASDKFDADSKHHLPKPDGKPGDQSQPIKVYVMLGQSNMLGFGRVGPKETKGSLEYMVKEKGQYPHLVDDAGNWTTRQDVRYVHVMDQRGVDYKDMEKFGDVRNEWLTPNKSFGPELDFGHVIGHLHDEPVLLLKACIGNRSLGWDLLPPGSERFEFEGKTYAGYKDVASLGTRGPNRSPFRGMPVGNMTPMSRTPKPC